MTGRLTRDEVLAKYSPIPHAFCTPEAEEAIFAGLPAPSYRGGSTPSAERDTLVREFAKGTLKAKRQSSAYISTLGTILRDFADADHQGTECLVTQRGGYGTERTVRTIQAQMLRADLLIRQVRSQGYGFVGEVFVYSPIQLHRHRIATDDYLEQCYREHEGQRPCHRHPLPANLSPDDVPY